MLTLNCPNCGAALPADAVHSDMATCQYCGTTFRVSDTSAPEPDMGNLILGADFSRKPIPGWSFPNEGNVQLLAGTPPELHCKFPAAKTNYYVLNSSGYFDDVDASVSLKFYEGEPKYIDAGIIVRHQKGVGSYGVLISPLGTFTVGYYEPGDDTRMNWKSIMSWSNHSALRPGLNEANRLRVIVTGHHLRAYINGVLAASLPDTRYDLGEVMLAAEPDEKSSIAVGFTDLQVREVVKE